MSARGEGDAAFTHDFERIRDDEAAWLQARRAAAGLPPPDNDAVGLALSGGGIRSAVFNLGLLQALANAGLLRRVDVLSSVSGGGYIASCFHWLRHVLPSAGDDVFKARLADGSGSVLDWLRLNGKFLIAIQGFSLWTLIASILAATLLNLLVLGPLLLLLLWLLSRDWWTDAWPHWFTWSDQHGIDGHDGFWLLLRSGVLLLLAFPVVAVLFGLIVGSLRARSQGLVRHLRLFMGNLLMLSVALIALGLIPLAARSGDAVMADASSGWLRQAGIHLDYGLALLLGTIILLLGQARARAGREGLAMLGLALLVYGVVLLGYYLAVELDGVTSTAFAVCFVLALLFAFTCDVNRVSMFAYYRSRLLGAFMPRIEGGLPLPRAEFHLHRFRPDHGAPLPLINTCLNTCSSSDAKRQARAGESFFLSPLWLGSAATGFRRSDDYAGDAGTLASAMTISAAAIDPDTHVTRGRAISFLMALLNVRLGFWGLNPDRQPAPWVPRPLWWQLLTREMFGIGLSEAHRHIHLSDGGHFENLGLYELIRRRLRYIVVSDAGADPDLDFSDLGRLIERVRVDFGAEVELAVDDLARERERGLVQRPWRMGRVRYADGSSGQILYLRPMMCEGLSADIYTYWRGHPLFPDESTANQFFGEAQFEAYRALGWEISSRLIGQADGETVADWFERLAGQETPAPQAAA